MEGVSKETREFVLKKALDEIKTVGILAEDPVKLRML